jgi:hypothetical protein
MFLWEAVKAVGHHIDYEKRAGGTWRATFNGAFRVTAEGRSPDDARLGVERQLDGLVATWIVKPPAEARQRRPAPRVKPRRTSTTRQVGRVK